MHSKRKSAYCISATGRIPINAAPIAAPAIAFSLMGVSMILSGPNSSFRPRYTPNAPPKPPFTPISSPIRKTAWSRRISSAIASRNASLIVSRRLFSAKLFSWIVSLLLAFVILCIHSFQSLFRRCIGRCACKCCSFVECYLHFILNLFENGLADASLCNKHITQAHNRIALFPVGFLFFRPITARVITAMTYKTVCLTFQQNGSFPHTYSTDGLSSTLVNRKHVHTIDDLTANSISASAIGHVFYKCDLVIGCRGDIHIVLTHEN